MNIKTTIAITTLAAALLPGCAQYVDIGGVKWHTANAPGLHIAAVGHKMTSGINNFSTTSTQPKYTPDIKPTLATIKLDNNTGHAALKLSGKAKGVGSGSVEGTWDKVFKANFHVWRTQDDITERLNDPINDKALDALKIWGDKARVITGIAMCYDQTSTVNTTYKAEGESKYDEVGGKFSLSGSGKHTVSYSDGTVFAYEMSRILWKRGRDGTPFVADLVPDRPGSDRTKPIGTEWDPAKLK